MIPDYISPEETEAEKLRLIKILEPELKTHGLVDATAYIKEHSIIHENHRHSGFVRSLVYKMESMGIVEVIPLKEWTEFYIKRTIWSKRHPYCYAAKLGAIGVGFSILAGVSIAITQAITKDQWPQKQQNKEFPTTKDLYDSVISLRHDLQVVQDTLTKHK